MTWPDGAIEPVSRLRVRTKAVVFVLDDATGRPLALPPTMRVEWIGNGEPVEMAGRWTRTLGGAQVLSGLTVVDGGAREERYRLVVEPDAALRPEQPDGYLFTVDPDPVRWPVRLVVRLLPGPAYAYPPRLPVVHGLVVTAPGEGQAVADAVVAASEDAGATVSARCGADHVGSFSLGIPRYRESRPTWIGASAPDGAVGVWRPLTPDDFLQSVHMTLQP